VLGIRRGSQSRIDESKCEWCRVRFVKPTAIINALVENRRFASERSQRCVRNDAVVSIVSSSKESIRANSQLVHLFLTIIGTWYVFSRVFSRDGGTFAERIMMKGIPDRNYWRIILKKIAFRVPSRTKEISKTIVIRPRSSLHSNLYRNIRALIVWFVQIFHESRYRKKKFLCTKENRIRYDRGVIAEKHLVRKVRAHGRDRAGGLSLGNDNRPTVDDYRHRANDGPYRSRRVMYQRGDGWVARAIGCERMRWCVYGPWMLFSAGMLQWITVNKGNECDTTRSVLLSLSSPSSEKSENRVVRYRSRKHPAWRIIEEDGYAPRCPW
jgi:hypothetical protein